MTPAPCAALQDQQHQGAVCALSRAWATPINVPAAVLPSPRHVQAKNAVLYCGVPLYAIGWYCADYREKEKLHHRY